MTPSDPLPANLAAAHAVILAERTARRAAEARAKDAEAQISGARLEIERLRLLLANVHPAPCACPKCGAWSGSLARM